MITSVLTTVQAQRFLLDGGGNQKETTDSNAKTQITLSGRVYQ